ncbi:MAG: hypothetical protein PHN63_05915, partial [Candidatus Omnitrophica bacterium]|nr:hypothetical protein [Candidatus Omnitrophota bacterium]
LAVGSGLYYGAFLTTLLTMVTLMIFSMIEHAMIRKDWYRTIIIDSKEGVGQLKAIREIFGDYRSDITDFEVEKAKDGTNMLLKVGLKLYETRYADRIIDDLAHLDGVKHVKWEAE